MSNRPRNIKEIKENGIACAFENQENYFVGVGESDVAGMPVYMVNKRTGDVTEDVGGPEFVLEYEVSDELDPNNPKVIREIDPETIKF